MYHGSSMWSSLSRLGESEQRKFSPKDSQQLKTHTRQSTLQFWRDSTSVHTEHDRAPHTPRAPQDS